MIKSDIDIIAENLMSIYPQLYKTLSKPMRSKTSLTPGGLFVLGALKRNGIMSMNRHWQKIINPQTPCHGNSRQINRRRPCSQKK